LVLRTAREYVVGGTAARSTTDRLRRRVLEPTAAAPSPIWTEEKGVWIMRDHKCPAINDAGGDAKITWSGLLLPESNGGRWCAWAVNQVWTGVTGFTDLPRSSKSKKVFGMGAKTAYRNVSTTCFPPLNSLSMLWHYTRAAPCSLSLREGALGCPWTCFVLGTQRETRELREGPLVKLPMCPPARHESSHPSKGSLPHGTAESRWQF